MFFFIIYIYLKFNLIFSILMGIGDWGLGIGDWGLGIGPNPQSPKKSSIKKLINNFIK